MCEWRQKFIFKSDTQVQGYSWMNSPLVLNIEALVAAVCARVVLDTILPGVIPVLTTHVLKSSSGETLPPSEPEEPVCIVVFHTILNPVQCEAALDEVILAGDT